MHQSDTLANSVKHPTSYILKIWRAYTMMTQPWRSSWTWPVTPKCALLLVVVGIVLNERLGACVVAIQGWTPLLHLHLLIRVLRRCLTTATHHPDFLGIPKYNKSTIACDGNDECDILKCEFDRCEEKLMLLIKIGTVIDSESNHCGCNLWTQLEVASLSSWNIKHTHNPGLQIHTDNLYKRGVNNSFKHHLRESRTLG